MSPEATVVIPTYNRRDVIGPTLAGALGQEDVDVEVVVVDDCSGDGTAEALRALDEPRLRVLRNESNSRLAVTRNRGIAEAKGEWVAFLDDDDLWSPRKLREQIDAADAAGADLAYSRAVVIGEDLDPIAVYYPPPPEEQPRSILESSSVPAASSNGVVRASLLRELGGFDERLEPMADWDMFIRLMLRGTPAVLDAPHIGYVLRAGNMSGAQLDRHFSDFDLVESRYRDARREYGAQVDGVQFSRWLAGGLRRGSRRHDAIRAYLRGARRYRNAGNLIRALSVPLGEGAMSLGSSRPEQPPESAPDWLDLYRPGERFAQSLDQLAGSA